MSKCVNHTFFLQKVCFYEGNREFSNENEPAKPAEFEKNKNWIKGLWFLSVGGAHSESVVSFIELRIVSKQVGIDLKKKV